MSSAFKNIYRCFNADVSCLPFASLQLSNKWNVDVEYVIPFCFITILFIVIIIIINIKMCCLQSAIYTKYTYTQKAQKYNI